MLGLILIRNYYLSFRILVIKYFPHRQSQYFVYNLNIRGDLISHINISYPKYVGARLIRNFLKEPSYINLILEEAASLVYVHKIYCTLLDILCGFIFPDI